ncbi:hypothetical protein PR202_ga00154 [Eleusine coracana subsp. coracana]|uniref:GDSL esterase/lipase n=1 Tax=Eleusine coracana subsp. coracana TaxID=191504 RepID=A0AAV5BBC1_ELECO|nr:hypothetical protein PR202_ga00154 [Eleusine coracana subsp. coracana]
MGPFSRLSVELLLLILVAAQATAHPGGTNSHRGVAHYSRFFVFGDSFTDTGNSDICPLTAGGISSRPPYGQTYFDRPSGRYSDGRIITDFLEQGKIMENSVFFVGQIGENDYFFALLSDQTVEQTARLVPHVVGAIRSAITVSTAAFLWPL